MNLIDQIALHHTGHIQTTTDNLLDGIPDIGGQVRRDMLVEMIHVAFVTGAAMEKSDPTPVALIKRDPKDRAYLQLAAQKVQDCLPDHHGFILMAIPGEGGDGRLKYVSSLSRHDAINVLKEWLINCSADEDWMKHL